MEGLSRDFYVLCPGAADGIRQWPVENFARLAALIFKQVGWRGLVCGSRSEGGLARELIARTDAPMQDLTGRTDIRGFARVLASARLMVGNESGGVHLAASVRTPAVCVLGGGHYGEFLPYDLECHDDRPAPEVACHSMSCFGCGWNCVFGLRQGQVAPCVSAVTVDDVWKKVLPIIIGFRHPALSSRAVE
jgi:ADP-heptose:LPS heptosyltransferase